MTQRNNGGMRLRQAPVPHRKDIRWLLQTLVALLACAVLTLTLTGLTGNGWGVMLASAACLSAVYGVMLKTRHESWFYIGILIVVSALIFLCRRQVWEGFRIFWNQAGDAMVSGTGWVLPQWELQLGTEQHDLCAGLFAGLSSCMISLMCCGLTSLAPAMLAVLLPVVGMSGMMVFGVDAGFAWLLPVLGVAVLILLYSGWREKSVVAPVALNWIVCAGAAGVLAALMLLPGAQSRTLQVREAVHHTVHEKKYETQYTTLPEGDFRQFKVTVQKPKQALSVTMEKPQQLYLRGFTGAVFTGERWEGLDRAALAENRELLYWLNLSAFDANAQFDAAAAHGTLEQSTVTVQNMGACSYWMYVPFTIGKGAWTQPENLNTDGVYGDGARSYVYSVTDAAGEELLQVVEYLQTSDDPAVLQYRRAESGYRQFIYHYYLQVPQECKALLQTQWDEIAAAYGGAENLTQQQAQECTLQFLSRCFPEAGTAAEIALPLENLEGTSFQYATVAAMTLRYFGMPARYAEGYVITREMASQHKSGEPIAVDSSCAKAWVEVYQDGIGWIPMDLTVGMGEVLEKAENSGKNQGDSQTPPEEEKKNEKPEQQEQPVPTGGTMVRIILETILWSLLIVLGVLLVIFLILWLRRKRILSQKEKKFEDSNCSDAIAWLYADTAAILEKLGFDRGNGSMRSLRPALEARFGADFAAQFASVSELNEQAMFSSCPMDAQQRKALRNFRSRVLRKLNTEVNWYRRMWLKWIRCLY